MVKHSLH